MKELKCVEIAEGLSQAMEETLHLGSWEGFIANIYMHPLNGNSINVWLQGLNIVIALHPNSVINFTDNTTFTFRIANTRNPDALWFQNDQMLKDLQLTHPALVGQVPVDVINVRSCVLDQSSDSPLDKPKKQFGGANECIHPDKFFGQLDGVRQPGCIPWYSVRVYITKTSLAQEMSNCYGWITGYVEDVAPEGNSTYSVLIHWSLVEIENLFDWYPYESVCCCNN
ncbi:hypothetical protein BT96DRAFT_933074 [Gymnopus androsaceus JB14]|uniref:Uncharacterized protein n=1 Tax=Gymnopus androsaceus JB14 TaxID=1447944 RepID=A0A6A4IEW0_9AGAR|nr:hypothetical protein BT96DRAFT_933074 [Gymnopus androsaceus JB14]